MITQGGAAGEILSFLSAFLLLDNTRRARVAPKGLLCRVLTNHPAERQDT